MKATPTDIEGVTIFEPRHFEDERGWFMETWRRARYAEIGVVGPFTQDNVSKSKRGVLRGLHYQHPNDQAKLVYALVGEILDVAVDIREGSPTFGKYVSLKLSGDNRKQLYIPEGFAHGFVVLSEEALVAYKCTMTYDKDAEGSLLWNDPDIGIDWSIDDPILSEKDAEAPLLRDVPIKRLPKFPNPADMDE